MCITNSRNDDEYYEWFFGDTVEEKEAWIKGKRDEQEKWNYHTAGAVSTRYYSFESYDLSRLLESQMSELKGMAVKDFITLIKTQL